MNKLSQKMTMKDPVEKIARKRLSVLQLAESLSNVTDGPHQLLCVEKAVYGARFGRIKGFTTNPQNTSSNNAGENGKTTFRTIS